MTKKNCNPLVIALDVDCEKEALSVCQMLDNKVDVLKVGLRLFLSAGPKVVKIISEMGYSVFLDLKLCDIPFQVSGAIEQIVKMNVSMLTVHTMGGLEMMKEAVQTAQRVCLETNKPKPMILGVTILTSWDQHQLNELGIGRAVQDQVLYLARLAQEAGLDGVVASPKEIHLLRKNLGSDLKVVTPGVRPLWAVKNDQKRVLTPLEAIKAGADYLVVGRPVLCSKDPAKAVSEIVKEIGKNR